jgi:DNA-binding NarL/FixJ family response regulator
MLIVEHLPWVRMQNHLLNEMPANGSTVGKRRYPVVKVMLVDDHALIRASLSFLLRATAGFDVVGECADGAEAPERARQLHPDVVLMDVNLNTTSGIVVTRDLLRINTDVKVLMLSGSVNPQVLQDAAQAGANGFVLKGGDPQELLAAVRHVADGGTSWPAGYEARYNRLS